MNKWPVFICYRQADGKEEAAWIYNLLKDQAVSLAVKGDSQETTASLDVYFDRAVPGVGDWKAVHEPYLKRSRALIVICTPGAKINEGEYDWVHREIDWWLGHREIVPILVDPLDEGARFVPDSIAERWPDAQRIRLNKNEWEGLSEADRPSFEDRIRSQFLGAIIPSVNNFYRQELEQEKKRTATVRRSRRTALGLGVAFITIVCIAMWIFALKRAAENAASEAHTARVEAEAAHQLAQTRVIEGQVARAQTEARLLGILQKFDQYDVYAETMKEWETEFQKRANTLRLSAAPLLPGCNQVGSFSVYEMQLVEVDLDNFSENETMFTYLAVVPGSSPRPGDWEPAVLDVFIAKSGEFSASRNVNRVAVKEMMALIPPENQWGLLMGVGTTHILTHLGRNYRINRTKINMNDEGDMIMGFDVCVEANLSEN